MSLIVPLRATPSQIVEAVLANQVCQIEVYQKFYGLFVNLSVSGRLVIGGVLCHNKNRIVRSLYLGFAGDLAFIDNQGDADPHYSGLGARFDLAYIEAAELPAGVG